MSTALAPEVTKPSPEETVGFKATTLDNQHQELVGQVETLVQGIQPGFKANPVTGESPVPDHPVWRETNAARIGSTELELSQDDAGIRQRNFKRNKG